MDYYDLKGVVETLLERLGFKPAQIEFRPQPDTGTFGPRCAAVWVEGVEVGLAGEIHPQVRAAFDLPAVRVMAAELRVAPLILPHFQFDPMAPISAYPPVVEDLAFIVAEEVPLRQVEGAIRAAGGELLAELELFDLYRGQPLAENQKSLAFRLTYQSLAGQVKESDVVKARDRIVRRVEREVEGKLRG
jgi:phenylalanyl-tRNA synthetase beta chain